MAADNSPSAPNPLGKLTVVQKSGAEPLHDNGTDVGSTLLDFWRWCMSDLVSNATRGCLAEFIVARALEVPTGCVRDEWAAFDLTTRSGITVEVKSSGFLQTWHQDKLSTVSFSTKATRAWDPRTKRWSPEIKRQADVYVFALLRHTDKATIDPLNVNQWRFWAMPTGALNARTEIRGCITLKALSKMCGEGVPFGGLAAAVEAAAHARTLDPGLSEMRAHQRHAANGGQSAGS